jgi:hypothetical protein
MFPFKEQEKFVFLNNKQLIKLRKFLLFGLIFVVKIPRVRGKLLPRGESPSTENGSSGPKIEET